MEGIEIDDLKQRIQVSTFADMRNHKRKPSSIVCHVDKGGFIFVINHNCSVRPGFFGVPYFLYKDSSFDFEDTTQFVWMVAILEQRSNCHDQASRSLFPIPKPKH